MLKTETKKVCVKVNVVISVILIFQQFTTSSTVSELERLHSSLVRCVYQHRNEYDKTKLTQVTCYLIQEKLLTLLFFHTVS